MCDFLFASELVQEGCGGSERGMISITLWNARCDAILQNNQDARYLRGLPPSLSLRESGLREICRIVEAIVEEGECGRK
jgi:hypothetical protein